MLAALQAAAADQRAVRGQAGQRQGRRFLEGEVFRHGRQLVGGARDLFGQRALVGHAEDDEVLALRARVGAPAVAGRDEHALADQRLVDAAADLDHLARAVGAQHRGQLDARVELLADEGVAVVERRRAQAHHRLAGGRLGVGQLAQGQRFFGGAELFQDDRSHAVLFCSRCRRRRDRGGER